MFQDNDDASYRARLAESQRNQRTNPAVGEDVRFQPSAWTPEQEAALVLKLHGDEAERLDRMISEINEQNRHR